MQLFDSELDERTEPDSGRLWVCQSDTEVARDFIAFDKLINDIVDVFEKQGLPGPEIKVHENLQNIQNKIGLMLEEIFMLIETQKPKSVEFGVWFRLKSSEALKDMFPIPIGDGYLMVWNTGRKAILDKIKQISPRKPMDR